LVTRVAVVNRGQPLVARGAKRLLDVVGASILLVLSLPLMALCALLIRSRSAGPVLFRQVRAGRQSRPFTMLKLRTMHLDGEAILERHLADSNDARSEWERYRRLRDDPRIIPGVGHWVRRLSLDELPQLWNVLRGDMSLVGPRPLELPLREQHSRVVWEMRLSVRPGMTGLWQVSGRSDTDIAALLCIDADYVERWSLWSDVVILCRTPGAVLSRRGAY
jgi:lipopolysaccharide/colanic/teichoic acid biosynthesis glycosyltransferase